MEDIHVIAQIHGVSLIWSSTAWAQLYSSLVDQFCALHVPLLISRRCRERPVLPEIECCIFSASEVCLFSSPHFVALNFFFQGFVSCLSISKFVGNCSEVWFFVNVLLISYNFIHLIYLFRIMSL